MESSERRLARLRSALSTRYHQFIVRQGDKDEEATLLHSLSTLLPHIPVETWEERSYWGGIFVNGETGSLHKPLPKIARIEYYEPIVPLESFKTFFPKFDKRWVVYEDDDLLVVFKPPRLPSLPGREQAHFSLRQYLDTYVGSEVHMPSRLDMSTAGLVAVSKSHRLHNLLQQLFERREIEKVYLLKAKGLFGPEGARCCAALGKDPLHPILRRADPKGKPAETQFFLLRSIPDENASIIEARPLSGRTHQIRVHSSFLGFPIVGDNFYEGPEANSLHLVSFFLRLRHPLTLETLSFSVPRILWPDWLAPFQEAVKLRYNLSF